MDIPGRALILVLLSLLTHPLAGQETRYDLLVSSRNTHSVKRFDGETGAYVDDFIPPRSGGLGTTQEILPGPDGDLIVSGRENTAILRYDGRTGDFKGAFTTGYALAEPTKMTWGPDGNLYVSQWGPSRENVAVFGPDGAFLREATPPLTDPMQHAWDDDGTLLVVYWGTRDVRRFDAEGNQLEIFIEDARLEGPVNLRWDGNHDLQVFDWQSGAIYTYDGEDGRYLDTFASGLANPEGWTVGPDGELYVGEWSAGRVAAIDAGTGGPIRRFAGGSGLDGPNSLLFIERPALFGMTASPGEVEVTRGSSVDFTVELQGTRGVSFSSPVDLACSPASADVLCSVDVPSVIPGDSVARAAVTVTAPAAQQARLPPWLAAVGALLALLSACGGIAPRGGRGRRGPLIRSAVVMLASVLLLVSCGAGSPDPAGPEDPPSGPGTPQGPDPIETLVTVTATSGDLVRRVNVRITGS